MKKPPGFFRRLAAIFYDLFLLLAILFLATAIALPFNNGEAFSSEQYLYPLWLLFVSFFFYAWFWTHGGQTLGLRSWKMTLLTASGKPVSWRQAAIRFVSALISWGFIGLGFLWIFLDPQKRAWHDIWSGTRLFVNDPQKKA
jgi:uncharacterized RDD family membrane protein YckC